MQKDRCFSFTTVVIITITVCVNFLYQIIGLFVPISGIWSADVWRLVKKKQKKKQRSNHNWSVWRYLPIMKQNAKPKVIFRFQGDEFRKCNLLITIRSYWSKTIIFKIQDPCKIDNQKSIHMKMFKIARLGSPIIFVYMINFPEVWCYNSQQQQPKKTIYSKEANIGRRVLVRQAQFRDQLTQKKYNQQAKQWNTKTFLRQQHDNSSWFDVGGETKRNGGNFSPDDNIPGSGNDNVIRDRETSRWKHVLREYNGRNKRQTVEETKFDRGTIQDHCSRNVQRISWN